MTPSLRWDIFCRVVDNFGDGGVCWRLARQLAAEHGLAVTLWIDDLATLARIEPALDAAADDQVVRRCACGARGYRRCRSCVADVVIEGFGCGCPSLPSRDGGKDAAARMGRPRIPVRGAWVECAHGCRRRIRAYRSRAGSSFRASPPTPAACCARTDCLPRATVLAQLAARRGVWRSTASSPSGRLARLALLLRQSGAAGIARCVGRRRRARRVRRAGRCGPVRTRPLDRRRRAASGQAGRPRPSRARRREVRRPGRLRPPVVVVRPEFRPRRGFVGSCALGHAPAGLAHLPASRGCAPHETRRACSRGTRRAWIRWPRWPSAPSGRRGIRATRRHGGDAWPAFRAAMPLLEARGRAWARALARQTDLARGLVTFSENRL